MCDNELTINRNADYEALIQSVGETLEEGRRRASIAVNTTITHTYWDWPANNRVRTKRKGKDRIWLGYPESALQGSFGSIWKGI